MDLKESFEVISIFLRWMEICQENNRSSVKDIDLNHLRNDVDHSSLLRRMLEGKEPLPKAPPKAFSSPIYNLADTGRYIPFGVKFYPEGLMGIDIPSVVIDQSIWNIIEKNSDEYYVIEWPKDVGSRYKLTLINDVWTLTNEK